MKLNRDRTKREIIATGLRVPYALRFNREGDLFLTDQEGETWLPGANPLDELHQILPGRHYGFPPRHDEYLPAVFDEPPVVGFGPQHQSTCGLVFNEGGQGRRAFGPSSWEGDAFVTGFSRGKLWRVRLLKTPAGYVGAPTLFGISNMMIADVAISPTGEMYLACHSGSPDWGSGPKGQGQLFRVRWVDQASPQVVLAWAAGPFETKIAFDRSVDPILLQDLTSRPIRFGEHVRAGDHLVVHAPPYKAVQAQAQASVGQLRIVSATLEDAGQTLKLTTDPHPASATYALHLPGVRAATSKSSPAAIDLDYNLNGVEAAWNGVDAEWSGWWPHLDPALTRRLLAGSPALDRLQPLLDQHGTLTLKTKLVHHRPTRLRFRSSHSFRILFYEDAIVSKKKDTGIYHAELATKADHRPSPLTLEVARDSETEGDGFSLQVEIAHPPDPTFRPLRLEDLRLPWAPPPLPEPSSAVPEVALDLSAGDPVRGESIFFGELARCSTCHAIRGRGADIGPDLSNLVHRDVLSVYRDIVDPGSVAHPDYVPSVVALKDGRVLTGLLRSEGAEMVRLIDSQGEMTNLTRGEIEEFAPGGASIMPSGLLDSFDEAEIRDLLAFLLREPEGSNDETKTSPSVSPGEK
ncbi:hypothetical protein BH23PLA1_BH23PLA1_45080 [soil metagenome]